MKKSTTIIISLLVTIVFSVASCFVPPQTGTAGGIFWTLAVSIIVFFLSYVSIELTSHIKSLQNYERLIKYESFLEHGINEYYDDFTNIKFKDDILNSRRIQLLLMYSRGFINNHLCELREFLRKENSILEIILITNDTEDQAYQYLTKKYRLDDGKLCTSLESFKRVLREDLSPHKHPSSRIILHHTRYLPAYSLFMFDDAAYFTLYKTAPERTNLVPSFKIEAAKSGHLLEFLKADYKELLDSSLTVHEEISKN